MTPTQVQHVLDKIGKLFPRSKLSVDEMQLFGEQLDRVEIEQDQADAVIEQHKVEHDYHNPKLSVLLARMKSAVQAKRIATAEAAGKRLVDRYRRHGGIPASVSDIDVAVRVSRLMADGTIHMMQEGKPVYYTLENARGHLLTMLCEFVPRERAEDIAYQTHPDDELYGKILARRERVAKMVREVDESGGRLKFSDVLKTLTMKLSAERKSKKTSSGVR